MASSSSSEKSLEKQPRKPPSHVALPPESVEKMKAIQNWGEKFRWSYDEEKIRRICEIQQNMDINDLLSYVMYGDGEEVVWQDDVWNVQSITEVPEAKRPTNAPPPLPAREKIAEPPAPKASADKQRVEHGNGNQGF